MTGNPGGGLGLWPGCETPHPARLELALPWPPAVVCQCCWFAKRCLRLPIDGAGTREADLALPALLLRRLLRGNMKAAIYFDNKQRGLGLLVHSGDAEELFWVY